MLSWPLEACSSSFPSCPADVDARGWEQGAIHCMEVKGCVHAAVIIIIKLPDQAIA
jgi:hypothetical protein